MLLFLSHSLSYARGSGLRKNEGLLINFAFKEAKVAWNAIGDSGGTKLDWEQLESNREPRFHHQTLYWQRYFVYYSLQILVLSTNEEVSLLNPASSNRDRVILLTRQNIWRLIDDIVWRWNSCRPTERPRSAASQKSDRMNNRYFTTLHLEPSQFLVRPFPQIPRLVTSYSYVERTPCPAAPSEVLLYNAYEYLCISFSISVVYIAPLSLIPCDI